MWRARAAATLSARLVLIVARCHQCGQCADHPNPPTHSLPAATATATTIAAATCLPRPFRGDCGCRCCHIHLAGVAGRLEALLIMSIPPAKHDNDDAVRDTADADDDDDDDDNDNRADADGRRVA